MISSCPCRRRTSARFAHFQARRTFGAALALLVCAAPAVAQQTDVSASNEPIFIANHGQWPADVRFRYADGGATAWIHDDGAMLALTQFREIVPPPGQGSGRSTFEPVGGVALRLSFAGATPAAPRGQDERAAKHNFFVGNEASRWATSVPAYECVIRDGLFPGVDLVWQRREGRLAYDLHVAPGADPRNVVTRIEGATSLDVAADGSLVIRTDLGQVSLTAPRSWEVTPQGRRDVPSRFVLVDSQSYRIEVERIDDRLPLVIDPGIEWATLLGGSANEIPIALKLDGAGRAFVCGWIYAGTYPTTMGAVMTTRPTGTVVTVVSCLDPSQSGSSQLVWSTYYGGDKFTHVYDLHVPPAGDVTTIVGTTTSDTLPLANAYQSMRGGGWETFIAQFTNDGTTLRYGTYLGGPGADRAVAIQSVSPTHFVIGGYTNWSSFPTTAGAFDTTHNGDQDAYLMLLDPLLPPAQQITAATFLGGKNAEGVLVSQLPAIEWDWTDIVVEPGGEITMAASTQSLNFPVTTNSFQGAWAGGFWRDVTVSRFDPTLRSLLYSTYVGSTGDDVPAEVVVDRSGRIAFAGLSWAQSPTTVGAYQQSYLGRNDGTLIVLRPAGQGAQDLVYGTHIGTVDWDYVRALAVESSGIFTAAGLGSGLTTTPGAMQPGGAGRSFHCRLEPAGRGAFDMHYLSQAGGGNIVLTDDGRMVALGMSGNPMAFTTPGAYQTTFTPGTAIELRLRRLCLLPTNMTRIDPSTPACLGALDIQVSRMPAPGESRFELICNDAPPNAAGVLLIGTTLPAPVPVLNIQLLVNPLASVPVTAGDGFARTRIPLPPSLPTGGPQVAFQYLFVTTPTCQGSGLFAASDAVAF